jgi:virginiamycin B lyase
MRSFPNAGRRLIRQRFGRQGVLWFTGQKGVYGRLDAETGQMAEFRAPRGTGPYGIAATPDGQVFFASLAGNYLG